MPPSSARPSPVTDAAGVETDSAAASIGAPRAAVRRVVVVVPAHDEVAHLRRCLDSVALAAARVDVPVDVVVVLDDCSDGTVDVVPAGVTVVEVTVRNVGAARAAGFAAAHVSDDTWCASTDADCEVPGSWLRAQLGQAPTHDVVAGTVEVCDWTGRHPALPPVYDALYDAELARGDGHRHVHGANLGISGAAYLAAGGFGPLRVHEDVDLVERCTAAGGSVCWSRAEPVVTSARVSHRTPQGFSSHLTGLEIDLWSAATA